MKIKHTLKNETMKLSHFNENHIIMLNHDLGLVTWSSQGGSVSPDLGLVTYKDRRGRLSPGWIGFIQVSRVSSKFPSFHLYIRVSSS
jgi:hypothetical protein